MPATRSAPAPPRHRPGARPKQLLPPSVERSVNRATPHCRHAARGDVDRYRDLALAPARQTPHRRPAVCMKSRPDAVGHRPPCSPLSRDRTSHLRHSAPAPHRGPYRRTAAPTPARARLPAYAARRGQAVLGRSRRASPGRRASVLSRSPSRDHSYSAQVPAITARRPPPRRMPAAAPAMPRPSGRSPERSRTYRARRTRRDGSRTSGRTCSTSSRPASRSASCQVTPARIGPVSPRDGVHLVAGVARAPSSVWRPTKPVAPVSITRLTARNPDRRRPSRR